MGKQTALYGSTQQSIVLFEVCHKYRVLVDMRAFLHDNKQLLRMCAIATRYTPKIPNLQSV